MRVRKAAVILGALFIGTAINGAQANISSFPNGPENPENLDVMLFASDPTVSYDPTGGGANEGLFTVSLGAGLLQDNYTGNWLNDPVFDMTVLVNRSTGAIDGGTLNVGGDLGSGDKVYYYSTDITKFVGDGSTFYALFNQQDAPGGTDQTYAFLQQSVGVTVMVPLNTLIDPNTSYSNSIGTIAKAYTEPLPEPVSMILVGMGLSALGLGVSRRSSR